MNILRFPYRAIVLLTCLFLLAACSDSGDTTSGTTSATDTTTPTSDTESTTTTDTTAVVYNWLTITSPNGGESWAPGSTHTITWEKGENAAKNAGYVGLHLYEGSGDSGTLVKTILSNPGEEEKELEKANDGSYSWTIPTDTPYGNQYEIRIWAKDAEGILEEDESNTAFTIGTSGSLSLTTTAFTDGGQIPETYTCDGSETKLSFKVSGVPTKAKSLVLFIDDISGTPTSTTTTTDWNHWVVFNIPIVSTINGFSLPGGSVVGRNDANDSDYDPLCPPGVKGDREKHTYRFELYAIDTTFNLGPDSDRGRLVTSMKDHLLEKGDVKGYFGSD